MPKKQEADGVPKKGKSVGVPDETYDLIEEAQGLLSGEISGTVGSEISVPKAQVVRVAVASLVARLRKKKG